MFEFRFCLGIHYWKSCSLKFLLPLRIFPYAEFMIHLSASMIRLVLPIPLMLLVLLLCLSLHLFFELGALFLVCAQVRVYMCGCMCGGVGGVFCIVQMPKSDWSLVIHMGCIIAYYLTFFCKLYFFKCSFTTFFFLDILDFTFTNK